MTTPNEPNQEFDVWNPDTWTDETAAFNSELNTETVIPLKPVEIKDFQTLTNQIYQGKYTGEIGFNNILKIAYELQQQYNAEDMREPAIAGVGEVRYAVAKSMGYTQQTFVDRFKAYSKDQASKRSDSVGFKLDAKGENALNILANATLALRTHPTFAKRFRLNLFSNLVEDITTDTYVSDTTVLQTTIDIQRMPRCLFGKDLIGDAIQVVARDNQYHPIKDYFSTLAWDGVDRLSKAGVTYWGTRTHIENVFVHKWLRGAAARILQPGIKIDTAIVLEGSQGIGKSMSLRALVFDPKYHLDHVPKIGDKEAMIQIRNKWIVELSELSAVRKSEVEDIKQFLSAQTDTFRPPYGKASLDEPRVCLFAGTTNSSSYLQDDTGNRRFWPLNCTTIDVDGIIRDRDQLWAQAIHEYNTCPDIKATCFLFLTKAEELLHAPLASSKLQHTLMDDMVQKWLEGFRAIGNVMIWDDTLGVREAGVKGWVRDGFKAIDVAVGIGMEPAKVGRPQEMAITASLRKFGFKSMSKNNVRTWRDLSKIQGI